MNEPRLNVLTRRGIVSGFAIAYAVAVAFTANSYHLLILTLVPVWATLGLAWNLFSGYSGLVSFGHAAFFGLGAYFVALAQINWGLSPWIGIPCAAIVGALAGLLIGIPTFRLRGHYFALAMLAYPLALLYVFEWLGYQELTLPMERTAPGRMMQFADHRIDAWLALTAMLATMLLSEKLERTRYGLSLLAIKQNEPAAEAAGIRIRRWKLAALMLSGAIAGAVGGFYAVVLLVVTPSAVFGMLVSAQALIVTMFGGVATLWGPVLGALVLVPMSELLQARLGDAIPGIQGVVYGLAIIAVTLAAPEGVFWKLRDLLEPRRREDVANTAPTVSEPADSATPAQPATERSPLLEVRNLGKAFGGVHAVDAVSLTVMQGEILGIIGPNGAGKTTLFNLLNGFDAADTGEILLDGKRIQGLDPAERCRAGIGRTFQVVKPFRRMTVQENIVVGAYARAHDDEEAERLARAALATVGLADVAGERAATLTNRQLRLLEIARAIAGGPRLLLLDETLAGLGAGELDSVLDVVRDLRTQGITIVIIEHTMQAMVRLVDRFVVLNEGSVLAVGDPAAITQNPAVIEAYLGARWRNSDA